MHAWAMNACKSRMTVAWEEGKGVGPWGSCSAVFRLY
jgi:hypothetical protein